MDKEAQERVNEKKRLKKKQDEDKDFNELKKEEEEKKAAAEARAFCDKCIAGAEAILFAGITVMHIILSVFQNDFTGVYSAANEYFRHLSPPSNLQQFSPIVNPYVDIYNWIKMIPQNPDTSLLLTCKSIFYAKYKRCL